MKRFRKLSIAGIASLLVAGCGTTTTHTTAATASSSPPAASTSAPSSHALKTVTFRLDYIPNGIEAPFVYGVKSGIYKKYGLNVQWQFGTGSPVTTQDVASGQVTFGIGDGLSALHVSSEGEPVTMVMGWVQRYAGSIIVPANSPIKTPANLVGHTLGIGQGLQTQLLLPGVMKDVHANIAGVHEVAMAPSALEPELFLHKVDAIITFGYEVQPVLAAKGMQTRVINFSDYGVDPLNLGVVTLPKTIQQHPNTVKAFVQATQASIKAAEQHPNAAVAALEADSGKAAPSTTVLLQQFKLYVPSQLQYPDEVGHPLGWMGATDWKNTETIAKTYLGLKKTIPVSQLYTNQFIQ